MKRVGVLFVCLGNICRSPTAEGVFTRMAEDEGVRDRLDIDSAGTSGWHIGSPPDQRAQQAARKRGVELAHLRGRAVDRSDFERFDYILAMDRENHANLQALLPPGARASLHLFLDFASATSEREVPDPYYGGDKGFEHVLDLIEDASRGLLATIRREQWKTTGD
jgi:protein-tyrosine phosphatase